jgi:PAS domain S-box-containing protein
LIQELVSLRQRIAELEQSESERKRVEEALQESEVRFRRLADATWEGIIIHREGIIMDANESALEMLGYPAEEVIGQSVLMLLAPESTGPALEKLRESIDSPSIYFEGKGLRKDKTVFPIEVLGRPIRYKNLDARVIAIRDITERKRLEEELKQHREYLTEMVRERTVELQMTNNQLHQEIAERKHHQSILRLLLTKEFRTLKSVNALWTTLGSIFYRSYKEKSISRESIYD